MNIIAHLCCEPHSGDLVMEVNSQVAPVVATVAVVIGE